MDLLPPTSCGPESNIMKPGFHMSAMLRTVPDYDSCDSPDDMFRYNCSQIFYNIVLQTHNKTMEWFLDVNNDNDIADIPKSPR